MRVESAFGALAAIARSSAISEKYAYTGNRNRSAAVSASIGVGSLALAGYAPWGGVFLVSFAVALEVRSVASTRDMNTFIKLPWRLYRNERNWVPPLLFERKRRLGTAL